MISLLTYSKQIGIYKLKGTIKAYLQFVSTKSYFQAQNFGVFLKKKQKS